MIDLNKYVANSESDKLFHSSGYAEVANAGRVGSVGGDSFSDRQKINYARQAVGSYNRSIIGQNYGIQRAKTVAPGNENRTSLRSRSTPGQSDTVSTRGFSEPASRSYNPYA